jgi:hypothetical protein
MIIQTETLKRMKTSAGKMYILHHIQHKFNMYNSSSYSCYTKQWIYLMRINLTQTMIIEVKNKLWNIKKIIQMKFFF